MLLILTTLAALAVAIPHPVDHASNIVARAGKACKTEGALVCNDSGGKFGVCSNGHAVFQLVAPKTKCVCADDEGHRCTIASSGNDALSVNQPSPPAKAPSHENNHGHKHGEKHGLKKIKQHKHAHENAPKHPEAKHQKQTPALHPPAAPAPHADVQYKLYLGNGSPSQGWPTKSEWASFEHLWTTNLKSRISSSCADFDQPNNSPEEIEEIRKAILAQSNTSGVDSRLALAMLVQESGGCVRVPTSNYGVNNPGLFQSHNGQGTCANANPCPDAEIEQMVKDGVSGTADGDGLQGVIQQAEQQGNEGVAADYAGLRVYNSGSIAASGKLEDGIATHCYVSDIANRLTGWTTGKSKCNLD